MKPEIKVEETRDWFPVWEVYQLPEVVDRVTNDAWDKLTDIARKYHVMRTVEEPRNHTFLVRQGGTLVGCFLAVWTPGRTNSHGDRQPDFHMVHTMLSRACRGAEAVQAGRGALAAVFALDDVDRLESWCPENNSESYYFARMCGFQKVGFAAMPWIKNGKEYPVRVVELRRAASGAIRAPARDAHTLPETLKTK